MFGQKLKTTLSLTIGGTQHDIWGGNVASVDLKLHRCGFSGSVEFWLLNDSSKGSSDDLLADFLKSDLIVLDLSVTPMLPSPQAGNSIKPLAVTGALVTDKTLHEVVYQQMPDRPVLARKYRVVFADPAAVLWKQHHPCELYVDKTLKQVIEAHLGDKITVDLPWSVLGTSWPMTYVHLPPEHGASFYDFVVWLVDELGGTLVYDYATSKLKLDTSLDASGSSSNLFADDIDVVKCVFGCVPRYNVNVLNSYSEAPANRAVEQAQVAQGMRHDQMMRSPIAQDVDDRVTLETARLQLPSYEVAAEFARFPADALLPGLLLSMGSERLFSADQSTNTPTWRVLQTELRIIRDDLKPDAYNHEPSAGYEVQLSCRLQQQDDASIKLPEYVAPRYPGRFEGKIVSEQGEETDKTYQIYTDQDTSQERYKIKIPLWQDQLITAPFEPYQGSGNVYIPAYRDARVLVMAWLHDARVQWLLDWRDGAPLPQAGQGENILFGKSATSNTTINHVYTDDKPALTVERTNSQDNAFIKIEEGVLTIKVWEKAE